MMFGHRPGLVCSEPLPTILHAAEEASVYEVYHLTFSDSRMRAICIDGASE